MPDTMHTARHIIVHLVHSAWQHCVATFYVVLIFCCSAAMVQSQSSGLLDLDRLSTKPTVTSNALLTGEQVPVDDVVNPDVYVVGPGDVIAYMTSGLDFSEKLTVISPENSVLLERLGIISAEGLTLTQLRDTIRATLKQRSPEMDIFLALRRPRLVYVSVKGNVPFPGTYAVPASMRVSTLVNVTRQPWLLRRDAAVNEQVRVMGASTSQTTLELTRTSASPLSPFAMRNIVVQHRHGTSLVDLARSKMPDGAAFDPHVREGDVIHVPFDIGGQPTISIGGAVASPATLVFKHGDRVSLLLAAAGGPLEDADLSRVFLIQADGTPAITLKVNHKLELLSADVELQPGSSVVVERKSPAGSAVQQGVVEVYGEVFHPGSVVITPGVTRVSEVLSRAGGIKPGASLTLSYIVRPDRGASSQRELSERSSRRFMYSDLKLEDTLRFQMDQFFRVPYVSCDLAQALADTNSQQNVALENGDIVVVESTPNQVFVYGQVNSPGYVPYQPKKNLRWYVEQAGGFAAGAEKGRSRIIRGKTKVWTEDDSDVYVYPGDEVYVPRPPAVPIGVELQTYAVIAGILSSVAALAATIITITR